MSKKCQISRKANTYQVGPSVRVKVGQRWLNVHDWREAIECVGEVGFLLSVLEPLADVWAALLDVVQKDL
jgi:hypothetical protein